MSAVWINCSSFETADMSDVSVSESSWADAQADTPTMGEGGSDSEVKFYLISYLLEPAWISDDKVETYGNNWLRWSYDWKMAIVANKNVILIKNHRREISSIFHTHALCLVEIIIEFLFIQLAAEKFFTAVDQMAVRFLSF